MISDIIKDIKILGMLLQQTEQQITEAKELLKIANEKHVEISELLTNSIDNNFCYVPKTLDNNVYIKVPKTPDNNFW